MNSHNFFSAFCPLSATGIVRHLRKANACFSENGKLDRMEKLQRFTLALIIVVPFAFAIAVVVLGRAVL